MDDYGNRGNRAVTAQMRRPCLTPERERDLLTQYQTASRETERQAALTELWESHSKLVVSIAQRYRRPGIELLDLVGAGHLGLYTAIARFDTSIPGVRLAGFAATWIRWSIADHIRRNFAVMCLPESNTHRQLFFMREKLLSDARMGCIRDGVEATEAELCERIAARIGMTVRDVEDGLRLLNGGVVSLDEQADDSPSHGWRDTLSDSAAVTEDDVILRLDQAKLRRRVAELIEEILGERERAVFVARCPFGRGELQTLETLSERFGVSKERIHQLETSARRKITTALANEGYTQAPAPVSTPRRTRAPRPAPVIDRATARRSA